MIKKLSEIKLYDVYGWILLSVVALVVFLQFYILPVFNNSIETSNYMWLVLSSMLLSILVLPVLFTEKEKKVEIGLGDLAVLLFWIYIIVNTYMLGSVESEEFKMSVSYIMLYLCFRVIACRYSTFVNYVVLILLSAGIYQSIMTLKQLYGFEMSNHSRFIVTGSFINPGPLGIYLSAILILAATVIKNSRCVFSREIKWRDYIDISYLQYIAAAVALLLTFISVSSTMSRAAWVGMFVTLIIMFKGDILKYFDVISCKLRVSKRILIIIVVSLCVVVSIGVYLFKKDSASGRLFIWRNCIEEVVDAPVTGIGIGNFADRYSYRQSKYFIDRDVLTKDDKNMYVADVTQYVFNEPLSLLLLLGVVGLLFAAFILWSKINSRNKNNNMLYAVVAILISSLFSYTFYVPSTCLIFLIALSTQRDRGNIYINRYVFCSLYFVLLLVNIFVNRHIKDEVRANKEWKELSSFYSVQSYDNVSQEYAKLYNILKNNYVFVFQYGQSLNKIKEYKNSNDILLEGVKHSTDYMFWVIIGNNYSEMQEYDKAKEAYLRSYYLCPSRIYPIYRLAKMYHNINDSVNTAFYGNMVINKRPKVESIAVNEMKKEVSNMLKNN